MTVHYAMGNYGLEPPDGVPADLSFGIFSDSSGGLYNKKGPGKPRGHKHDLGQVYPFAKSPQSWEHLMHNCMPGCYCTHITEEMEKARDE